jgi:FdhE protein
VTALDASPPSFDGLAREHPEWRAWLAVMRAALEHARDPDWRDIAITRDPASPAGAPWLAGARVEVNGRAARRWLEHLVELAGESSGPAAGRRPRDAAIDPTAFLGAALELDLLALEAAGDATGLDAGRARALAHPASLPLLATCAERAGTDPNRPRGWDHGYCPVCGAWPALAEVRGLEASRQLRCARCGADWTTAWLSCVYCGNDDHRELAGLVSEVAGAMRRVDTCARCRGYLKSVITLTARTHAEVILEDMATVSYDLSALGEGAHRPAGLGASLGVEVRLTHRRRVLGWRR